MDNNLLVASLLRDLAAVQTSKQKRWGYSRAAEAILALDVPIETLVERDGTLRKIPGVGPSSTRVVLEVLKSGGSSTVDAAVAASPKHAEISRRRDLTTHFLSRAEVEAALGDKRLRGPSLTDYRGDLQMHSEWSDGRATLDEMADGCLARGYQYAAITDHSHGLRIAGGMTADDLLRQHEAIDAVNRRLAGRFRLLKSVEANILADGTIDVDADMRRRLDLVVAAPHAQLRSTEDQTSRLLRVVETPGVHILGHPRGRKLGARAGIVADWDAIFRAAARRRVAVEIDGDPSRQDLDYLLAKRAVDAGCLIALDSDAHAVDELPYAETALAHARLAGIAPSKIVNCWSLDKLLAWAGSD